MKKLLCLYNFNSDMEYYEMIATSFLNGLYKQAYDQFDAMPKIGRVSFLKSATIGGWSSGLDDHKLLVLFDHILK